MEPTTERVAAFIARHELDAEIVPTPTGVPTVETAATALGVSKSIKILKTLVFIGPTQEIVIAIACGTGRVDRKRLAEAAGLPKVARLAGGSTGFDRLSGWWRGASRLCQKVRLWWSTPRL